MILDELDHLAGKVHLVNLIPSKENTLKVIYHYDFVKFPTQQGQKHLTQALENLSPIKIIREQEGIRIGLQDAMLYDQITPFIPVNVTIDLHIPTRLKFQLFTDHGRNPAKHHLHFPDRVHKYGHRGNYGCDDWISYQEDKSGFYCPITMHHYDRQFIIEKEIKNLIDTLVPLKGHNPNRKRGTDHYRKIHSTLWQGDTTLIVKVSDKFWNLFLQIEAKLDETGNIQILSSQLQNIEQK
ncbi:MAG: hypothetical protein Q4B28_03680 [bacterium]|nr:hypothetical protein [bacterium]